MQNFDFCSPTRIFFGRGTQAEAGRLCAAYGKKVLLHYGGGSIKRSGLYDQVMDSLKKAGLGVVELGGVQPNPRLKLVYEGIKLCKSEGVELILAVGGGSVIDSAKAIAMGACIDGDVWDFYAEKAVPERALPVGVVLTIPAAGSECSQGTVISHEELGLKRPVNDDILRPAFAIMNPELTFTLDAYQTACGVVDMMAHIMERYFTNEADVDVSDRLCEGLLKSIIKVAPAALVEPDNYSARAEIMWAGTLAHTGLIGMGRVEDWASHRIEHELSAKYDVAHGAGLATVFPVWMEYVYDKNPARFAQFAHRVWDIEMDFQNPHLTIMQGIAQLRAFFKAIGMPVTFEQLGAKEEDIPALAANVQRDENGKTGSFMELDTKDIEEIYHLAL